MTQKNASTASAVDTHHLSRLAAILPQTSRSDIISMFKCREPTGLAHQTTPLQATLYGGEKPGLVVEFDTNAEAVFAEISVKCESLEKALSLHRRLDDQLLRGDLVMRSADRKPPIRRTTLPLQQLHAWNRWELDERRSLQILVGTFSPTNVQAVQVKLAVGLHIHADHHGYGPKLGDISTGQAIGWDEIYDDLKPDLNGRINLMRDATSTIGASEPGRYGPSSVFRICP